MEISLFQYIEEKNVHVKRIRLCDPLKLKIFTFFHGRLGTDRVISFFVPKGLVRDGEGERGRRKEC